MSLSLLPLRRAADTLERRRLLWLVAAGSVALLYSFWNGRSVFSELLALLGLAGLVVATGPGTWPRRLVVPALVFAAAFALSTLASLAPARSWRALMYLAAYACVFALAGNLLARGWRPGLLYRALVLTSLIVLLILVVQWLIDGAPVIGYRLRYETNNSMALYNLLLFPALVVGELRALVLAPAVFVLWFSASRGGVLGLAGGLAVLARFEHQGLGWLRRHWRPAALAGLGLAVALGVQFDLLNRAGRGELWGVALEMWRAQPVTGTGPDTYQIWWLARPRGDWPAYGHAHNTALNTLAELGVAGLAAGAWLTWCAARELYLGARRGARWSLAALASLVAMLAQNVGDHTLTQAYVTVTMLVIVRIGLWEVEANDGVLRRLDQLDAHA